MDELFYPTMSESADRSDCLVIEESSAFNT